MTSRKPVIRCQHPRLLAHSRYSLLLALLAAALAVSLLPQPSAAMVLRANASQTEKVKTTRTKAALQEANARSGSAGTTDSASNRSNASGAADASSSSGTNTSDSANASSSSNETTSSGTKVSASANASSISGADGDSRSSWWLFSKVTWAWLCNFAAVALVLMCIPVLLMCGRRQPPGTSVFDNLWCCAWCAGSKNLKGSPTTSPTHQA
mmetsp:Transcript_42133/g.63648  ORF Transcript_42133/g.63648 Transcript_42133/m.63648 type:complete len:210 (-) Transcript_42133:69-698(-)